MNPHPTRRRESFVVSLLKYITGYTNALPVLLPNNSKHDPKQRGEYKMDKSRAQRQKMKAHNKRQKRMNPMHGRRA